MRTTGAVLWLSYLFYWRGYEYLGFSPAGDRFLFGDVLLKNSYLLSKEQRDRISGIRRRTYLVETYLLLPILLIAAAGAIYLWTTHWTVQSPPEVLGDVLAIALLWTVSSLIVIAMMSMLRRRQISKVLEHAERTDKVYHRKDWLRQWGENVPTSRLFLGLAFALLPVVAGTVLIWGAISLVEIMTPTEQALWLAIVVSLIFLMAIVFRHYFHVWDIRRDIRTRRKSEA